MFASLFLIICWYCYLAIHIYKRRKSEKQYFIKDDNEKHSMKNIIYFQFSIISLIRVTPPRYTNNIMKQSQQLLYHSIPKFHRVKEFFIANSYNEMKLRCGMNERAISILMRVIWQVFILTLALNQDKNRIQ